MLQTIKIVILFHCHNTFLPSRDHNVRGNCALTAMTYCRVFAMFRKNISTPPSGSDKPSKTPAWEQVKLEGTWCLETSVNFRRTMLRWRQNCSETPQLDVRCIIKNNTLVTQQWNWAYVNNAIMPNLSNLFPLISLPCFRRKATSKKVAICAETAYNHSHSHTLQLCKQKGTMRAVPTLSTRSVPAVTQGSWLPNYLLPNLL
jgi:hypothetical protein